MQKKILLGLFMILNLNFNIFGMQNQQQQLADKKSQDTIINIKKITIHLENPKSFTVKKRKKYKILEYCKSAINNHAHSDALLTILGCSSTILITGVLLLTFLIDY